MSPKHASEQFLSVEDVATYVGVAAETVRRWLRTGELRGVRLGGKAGWRIREDDLRVFLDRRWNVPEQE